MQVQDLEKFNLPEMSGVYFFVGPKREILYIGKATNLKDRVRSYFSNDLLLTRGSHILTMVTLATEVKFQTTRSVLEALLLESELIKKYQPLYNTKEKDDKSYFVLVVTEEDFPRVLLMRKRTLDKEIEKGEVVIKKTFGPYASGEHARNALKLVRRIFPFRDKCEVFSASDPKRLYKTNKCFSYELGLCPGVCRGIMNKKQYQKHIDRLIQFLEGDGEGVRRNLEKAMQEASDRREYEEAQKIKETLFALEHIRDAHLIQREVDDKTTRIEAYDISHISGTDRVGVMTVVRGGVADKSQYKKFKLSKDKNDDLEGLSEVLRRRLKHLEDWGIPSVIVLDGDERHLARARQILEEELGEHNIAIVAVVKDRSHKAKAILGDGEAAKNFKQDIVLANAEAHRFSLAYHRLLRSKKLGIDAKKKTLRTE